MKKLNKNYYWVIFSVIIIIFFLIELKALPYLKPGDENVYLYMEKLISEGKIPYKDFFLAHPPLQILIIAAVFKIVGFNIFISNLMPLLFTLLSAFFLFKIVKEKFNEIKALAAVALFLFSFSTLSLATDFVGINLTAMFAVIGFYCLFNKNNYIKSGIFFGLASITRLYSLVPIFVILIVLFLRNKKGFYKFLLSFSSIFVTTNLILLLLFGPGYFVPVYSYHLMKPFSGEPKLFLLFSFFKINWFLFLFPISFIFARNKKKLEMIWPIAVAYFIFLFTLKKVFEFYLLLLFPFLAILAVYGITDALERIKSKNIRITIIAVLSLVVVWNITADSLFLINHSFMEFESGKDMAAVIKGYAPADAVLFGDSSITPLMSFMSGRKIAFDFADSNEMRFEAAVADIKKTIEMLKKENVVVITQPAAIGDLPLLQYHLNNNCKHLKTFWDRYEGEFSVFYCPR